MTGPAALTQLAEQVRISQAGQPRTEGSRVELILLY